jgi:hypothetical protein
MPLHFDSQTKAKHWNPFWRAAMPSRPESRLAACMPLHFDSQTKATQVAFFPAKKKPCSAGFLFGRNWNRTSDTRIFSPLLYRLSYPAIGVLK